MSVADAEGAVHIGLRDRAAGVGFEGELFELPDGSEAPEQLVEARLVTTTREGAIEAVLALEDRLRSREARVPKERRHDTRVSRPARVQSFGPRAVGQVFDDSAPWLPQIPKA